MFGLSPTQWRAIAGIVSAVCTFTIVTQSDVTVAPVLRYALGAIVVAIATIDWGAFGIPKAPSPDA